MQTTYFPFTKSTTGGVKLETDQNEINLQMLQTLIGTAPGEMEWEPTFGCQIHFHTFEPNNNASIALAKFYIQEAVKTWVPTITANIDVSIPEENILEISIETYTITIQL